MIRDDSLHAAYIRMNPKLKAVINFITATNLSTL